MSKTNSIIRRCSCQNYGQDKLHGEQNRVFNMTSKAAKAKDSSVWRCTVCSKEIENKVD